MTPPTGYVPFDTVGVKYVTSIPDNPDPSIVYMLWDGIDADKAVRWEPNAVFTAATLPDPATLAISTKAVLTGAFSADVTAVSLTVDYVKGVKSWTGTVVSANDPVDADGLPNGVTWVKV